MENEMHCYLHYILPEQLENQIAWLQARVKKLEGRIVFYDLLLSTGIFYLWLKKMKKEQEEKRDE